MTEHAEMDENLQPVNEWNVLNKDGALDGGDAEHAVRVALGLGGGDAAAATTAATQGLSRRRRLWRRGGV